MARSEWTKIGAERTARWLGPALIPDGASVISAKGKFTEDGEAVAIVIDLSNGRRLTWRQKKKGSSLTFSKTPKSN